MPSRLRRWVTPARPEEPDVLPTAQQRGYGVELVIVFAMTLGLSGFRSLLSLLEALAKPEKLGDQKAALNISQAAQSWLDLGFQLAGVVQLAAWGGIAVYLLWRGGLAPRFVGLGRDRPTRDLLGGLALTACIGIPGLGLYLGAQALDVNLTVLPTTLDDHWWRVPTLILAAAGNAWAEEVLVVGYLGTRLRQFGLRENTTLLASAVLRGSYHLYQGFGGFVGNLVMGVIFCRIWQRTNRLWPLVIAHTMLDVAAFVGYALLRDHVGWLPG